MNNVSDTGSSPFSYKTLDELVEACVKFHRNRLEKSADRPEVHRRRGQLAGWVRKFHEECGTLSPQVEESIDNLINGSCVFLMTAHQPNLFAYSGVLRKATLNQVLAEKLAERLKLPVVTFFGLADQDFTDDRWAKSALLPDVERRDGVLELRLDLPEKMMLFRVMKPAEGVLDKWRSEIRAWFERNLRSIEHYCISVGAKFEKGDVLSRNLESFWSIVKEAYSRAVVYSDFNGFTMSKIVNKAWGYPMLFARFSECQQIFQDEFEFLLSHFEDYSRCLKEALCFTNVTKGGVYEEECSTVPFWYHCACGGKARLAAEQTEGCLVGRGPCLRCGQKYRIDFGSNKDPHISEYASGISARSLSMPLVFFNGLNVSCYVGGVGGKEYLRQAEYVAKGLELSFPPVGVWRPKDEYLGLGQLDALFAYRHVSGSWDLSLLPDVETDLRKKIAIVQSQVDELEGDKKRLLDLQDRKEGDVEKLKALSGKQNEIRRLSDFSVLVRNVKLLESVSAVMRLHPCVIDYGVNVGLRETSEQWIGLLKRNGDLFSDIRLKTGLEEVAEHFAYARRQ